MGGGSQRGAVVPVELAGETQAQVARDEEVEQALDQEAGQIGVDGVERELGPAEAAGEGDGVEHHDIDGMGDCGRAEEAQQGSGLAEMLADVLENAVVGELAGDEASGAAEKNHAGKAGDLVEVEVVDAGGGRQEVGQPKRREGDEVEGAAAPSQAVGGTWAVDLDHEVTDHVGQGVDDEAGVESDEQRAERESPDFGGEDIGEDHQGALDGSEVGE